MKRLIFCLVLSLLNASFLFAQQGETHRFDWARSGGSDTSDFGEGITTDPQGNSYVVGGFANTATFGSFSLTSTGNYDGFIAKLDSAGNYKWVKKIGGVLSDINSKILLDN